MMHIEGTLQSVSLVLCNDKPQTFGAPDVLQLSTDQVTAKYIMHQHFHDRPPDQVRWPFQDLAHDIIQLAKQVVGGCAAVGLSGMLSA